MTRPDPIQRLDSAFFWEACQRHELVVQKCEPCGVLWHPPRPMCPDCHSVDKSYEKLSGKGAVLSWARQIRPETHGFTETPIAVLLELDEGVRMVAGLAGVDPADVTIGMRVTVGFEPTVGGMTAPVFRPEGGQ